MKDSIMRKAYTFITLTALFTLTACTAASSAEDIQQPTPQPAVTVIPTEPAAPLVSEDPLPSVTDSISPPAATPTEIPPHMIYLGDFAVLSNESFVDLSGVDCTGLDVGAFLDSLTDVKEIRMRDNGLKNDDYAALQDSHPGIRIIWDIKIKKWTIPTDTVGFSTLRASEADPRIDNDEARYLWYCHDMVALDLGHNYISDLSFLEGMPELKIFIIVDNFSYAGSGVRLKDITPIKNCKKLRYLEMFANSVEDISVLKDLKELEDLNICHNPIKSADGIKELPNLKKLWVYSTSIPSEEIAELKALYPECTVVTSGSGSVDQGWRGGERYKAMRNMVKNNVIDPVYADSVSGNSVSEDAL